jgi:crotonobetainyl-CoA:carnitine CoA-transferase CaiB-like acyl-CoA transferase
MLQFAMTGLPAAPMPARISPWGVYDVFTAADGEQIFISAVSDAQWATFCQVFDLADLKDDPKYATNNDRVRERATMMPILRERLGRHAAHEIARLMESNKLPYAPIRKPEELFDDEHLLATGGLADMTLPDGPHAGETSKATLFPFTMDGQRLGVRLSPPTLGSHTDALLQEMGYATAAVKALRQARAVG